MLQRTELCRSGQPTIVATTAGPEAGPPVVLLPGGGQTRHAWDRTALGLAALGLRVVAPDLRGHGDSGWSPTGDYSIEAYADDLRALVAGIGRPVALVGASLGGRTALIATGEPPGCAASCLVLVDFSSRPADEGIDHIRRFMQETIGGFDSLEHASGVIARFNPHRPLPKDPSGLRKNLRQRDDGRWYWHWDPLTRQGGNIVHDRDAHDARLDAAARRVDVPVLVLRGARSEVIGAGEAQAFASLFMRGEYGEIAGARHMLASDHNDAFVQGVAEFVVRQVGGRRR